MLKVVIKYDKEGIFLKDILDFLVYIEFIGVYIFKEYGGFGGGVMEMCFVVEEFLRNCVGVVVLYAVIVLGVYFIIFYGKEE